MFHAVGPATENARSPNFVTPLFSASDSFATLALYKFTYLLTYLLTYLRQNTLQVNTFKYSVIYASETAEKLL